MLEYYTLSFTYKVFPPVSWSGRYRSHLTMTPSEDNIQSQCLYPSSDHGTPPYIHSLNGTQVIISLCYINMCLSVVCQLEASGKWPDEVEAIQQIKAAFYVKMSELLNKDHSLVSSPTLGHLDVLKVGPHVCLCGNENFCHRMGLYFE